MNSTRLNNTVPTYPSYIPQTFGLFHATIIFLSVLIIFANSIVIFLFCKRSSLRTTTNYVLISLSVSDFLAGLVCIPLSLTEQFLFMRVDTGYLVIIAPALYRFTAVSTMLHIFGITWERYVSVMYPLRYIRIVTKQRIITTIIIIWLISLFNAMIPFSWTRPEHTTLPSPKYIQREITYWSCGLVLFFILPFVIMVFCYSCMFMEINRQIKDIRKQNLAGRKMSRPILRDYKAVFIFAAMLIVYIVCWFGWYVIALMYYINYETFSDFVVQLVEISRISTSIINPVLYSFLKHDFRNAARSIFGPFFGIKTRRDHYVSGNNGTCMVSVSCRKDSADD